MPLSAKRVGITLAAGQIRYSLGRVHESSVQGRDKTDKAVLYLTDKVGSKVAMAKRQTCGPYPSMVLICKFARIVRKAGRDTSRLRPRSPALEQGLVAWTKSR
jgi:hypothetical protein